MSDDAQAIRETVADDGATEPEPVTRAEVDEAISAIVEGAKQSRIGERWERDPLARRGFKEHAEALDRARAVVDRLWAGRVGR